MTQICSTPVLSPGEPPARDDRGASTRRAWVAGALVLSIVAFLYALLQNHYWIRHGDSELYLSVARNLVRGEGFRFNGQPVAIIPPGWPLLLAAGMKLSLQLFMLKLIPMFSMLGFLAVSFAVIRRFTSPGIAAFCILVAASLEPVASLSYLFFSDSMFALLAMSAVWAALRVNDDDGSIFHAILLLALCAAMMFVRWAGLPWFVVIGGACIHGELWPRMNRRWVCAVLAGVVTLGSFVALRKAARVDPSQIDPRYDSFVAINYDLDNTEESLSDQAVRVLNFGLWTGGLLWRPVAAYLPTRDATRIIGWIVGIAIVVATLPLIRRRQWLWLGILLYLAVLVVNWPHPMPRYVVPAAPLVVLAAYAGVASLASFIPWRWSRTVALNLLFASVLLVNGIAYLGEAIALNHPRFYDRYEGGVHKQLIEASRFLTLHGSRDGEIAISQRWANFDRITTTDGFRRAAHFLIDRPLVTVPEDLCREPDRQLIAWLTEHNVRYYLYQPAFFQRWHFAARSRNGIPITQAETEWRLYEIADGRATRVRFKPTLRWPTRVPGL